MISLKLKTELLRLLNLYTKIANKTIRKENWNPESCMVYLTPNSVDFFRMNPDTKVYNNFFSFQDTGYVSVIDNSVTKEEGWEIEKHYVKGLNKGIYTFLSEEWKEINGEYWYGAQLMQPIQFRWYAFVGLVEDIEEKLK